MVREVYYEYHIDLRNYQCREADPDVVLYNRGHREAFITCLRHCGNKRLETERRIELKRGSKIYLYKPTNHIRGYMVLTARGKIKDYGVWGKDLKGHYWNFNSRVEVLIKLLYACMNDASLNIDRRPLVFKVPVRLYRLNRGLEKVWLDIGCKIKVHIKYLWIPKEVEILGKNSGKWRKQVN